MYEIAAAKLPVRLIGRPRLEFLGCQLDNCTMAETVEHATAAMHNRERFQHGDVNVAKLVGFQGDPDLLRYTAESDIVCVDGTGILWGCWIMGIAVPERVAGADLMEAILSVCEGNGFRPYLLGARQDVLEKAVEAITRRFPTLRLAGWRNGYFSSAEESEVVETIRASKADCLFVGISSPIKERFLNRHRDTLGVPVQLGVGGAFDVLAGFVKRAPPWVQAAGLEWVFRLLQEPRRLWRRYLVSNATFAGMLAAALAHRVHIRRSAYPRG